MMTMYNQIIDEEKLNELLSNLSDYQIMYENCRKNLSKISKGRKLSKETREKISIANKGKNTSPKSDTHKQALKNARDFHSSTSNRKSIYNEELNKVKFVYESELDEYLNSG